MQKLGASFETNCILSQISLPWQRGVNLNDAIKLDDPENCNKEQKLRLYIAYNQS